MRAYLCVLGRLDVVKKSANKASARCPAHEDHKASLSVSRADQFDGVVLHCHVGCKLDDLLAKLKLTEADLFDNPRDIQTRLRRCRRLPVHR
jgi:hypothetical protein